MMNATSAANSGRRVDMCSKFPPIPTLCSSEVVTSLERVKVDIVKQHHPGQLVVEQVTESLTARSIEGRLAD